MDCHRLSSIVINVIDGFKEKRKQINFHIFHYSCKGLSWEMAGVSSGPSISAIISRSEVLQLYRQILRTVGYFKHCPAPEGSPCNNM